MRHTYEVVTLKFKRKTHLPSTQTYIYAAGEVPYLSLQVVQ